MTRFRRTRRLWLEELESRLLLSADFAPMAAEQPPFPETELHQAIVDVSPATSAPVVPGRFELVFVDAAVPDYARLVAGIEAQNDGWRRIDVVVLDPQRDGVAQVTEALSHRVQLDAVHFVSHGADGALQLGATRFDADALADREAAVAGWGASLKADGDLLFYGCDLAATAHGEAFLARLAALAGADVAASADLTGAAALGGDWRLEFELGVVASEIIVSTEARAEWGALLSTQTLDWDEHEPADPDPWIDASLAHTFAVGPGAVAIAISGDIGLLTDSTPHVSTHYNGGTGENTLRLQSSGFTSAVPGPAQSVTVTLDFSAFANGVSNVSFSIFDLDAGGFIDRITTTSDQGDPTAIVDSDFNDVSGTSAVAGNGLGNSGNGEPFGNATFTFAHSGITTITIVYSNDGAVTNQGVGIHDISFDPTPVASDRGITASEDATHVFTVADFGFVDVDGDTLQSVRITQLPAAGTLFLAGSGNVAAGQTIGVADIAAGNLRFIPSADANGTPYASFRFQVGDGASFSASDYRMTVNLTAVNDAPTLAPLADQSVDEDAGAQTVIGFAAATPGGGADEAAQTLAFTVTNDYNALFAVQPAIAANGTLTYTPAANAFGSALVTVLVRDDGGTANGGQDTTGPLAFTLTVNPVNDAPVLAGGNDLAGIAEDDAASAGTLVSALVAGQVTDADPGALTGIAVTAVDDANGTWQYSLDGGGVWVAFGTPTLGAARLLAADALTRVRFVPAADWNGTATIDFRAWDRTSGMAGGTGDATTGGGTTAFSSASATATIAVNAVADAVDDAASVNEDPLLPLVFNVLANDTFENAGRALTGVAGAANGSVAFDASGAVTYTPNADWNGTETLTYTVTSGGVTETATLAIAVNPVNDAPVFTLGANQTVNEDAGAQLVAAFAVGAPGGGADEAGQTLAYTVNNNNNALFLVQPSIAADGTLTYTPAADAHGAATVSVFLSDDGGIANGGVDTSPPQSFTISVAPVADTPSVSGAATLEDVQTTSGLVISRNPADDAEVTHYKLTAIAGGTLFLSDGTTAVADGSFITAAQGAAGLRFTPAANSVVAGTFDVQAAVAANDAGLGGGTVTATVTVTAVNDAPSFVLAANQTVDEDAGAQLVALFAVGSPGGGPDEAGQTFTYTVGNDNNALFAVQPTIAANGTLAYVPAANMSGTATVTVSLSDDGGTANGGVDTASPQTFAITVAPVADAPVVAIASAAGNEDTPIALTVNPALTDTDGSETLAVVISAVPVGTTLTDGVNAFTATAGNQSMDVSGWNLAALSVTPPADSDADFTLTVSATATETANGALATTSLALAVDVVPVNDPPMVVTNRLALSDGAAVVVASADLAAIDVDNPPTDIRFSVSGVRNGRFELGGAPGLAITAFTSAELAAGEVRFVHAGNNQAPDYFVTPDDGALSGAVSRAAITFAPSAGTPAGLAVITPPPGLRDEALLVAVPPTPPASGGDSLAFSNLSDASPIPRGLGEFEALVLPEPPILAIPTRVAIAAGDPGFAKIDPKVEYEPLEVLRMPGPALGLAFDRLEFDDFRGRGDVDVLMGAVKMAGLVLSVGVLWWATRAAGLLASALSALPAWRNFDPIFVVGRDDDEEIEWRRMDDEAEQEEEAVGRTLEAARDGRDAPRRRGSG